WSYSRPDTGKVGTPHLQTHASLQGHQAWCEAGVLRSTWAEVWSAVMATAESLRRRGGGGAHGEPPPLKRFPKAERRWGHRPLECRLAAVRLTLPVAGKAGIDRHRHRNLGDTESYISHGLRIQSHDSPRRRRRRRNCLPRQLLTWPS
ncbi:hypothetical protein BHM03_00022955, partial [Ensete ventricosum]